MYTGFAYATRAGVSIGIDDMVIRREEGHPRPRPNARCWRSRSSTSGLVTAGERYNKVVDIWSRTNERSPRR
jgi:DNA-directed RNA polymerase subunit beta'